MTDDRADLRILTTSRAWSATPWDYNSLNFLKFNADGSGQLVLGYGQSIHLVGTYRFEVAGVGLLRLTYVDSPSNQCDSALLPRQPDGKRLWGAELGVPKDIRYELSDGEFRGQQNMGSDKGPFTYHFRWVLTLDRAPYPDGIKLPWGNSLTYCGHGGVGPPD